MKTTITYSVDGGVTWRAAKEGVRVAVQSEGLPELSFNVTYEGVITDAYLDRRIIGTDSATFDEITERLS